MRKFIEQYIRATEVSLHMEGIQVSDDCKEMCRRLLFQENHNGSVSRLCKVERSYTLAAQQKCLTQTVTQTGT